MTAQNINITSPKENFSSVQIEAALLNFLDSLLNQSCSNATIRNYRSDIRQFYKHTKQEELGKIFNKNILKAFVSSQKQKGLKDSSITRKIASITQFALWSKKQGLISQNIDWINGIKLNSLFREDHTPVSLPITHQVKSPVPTPIKTQTNLLQKSSAFLKLIKAKKTQNIKTKDPIYEVKKDPTKKNYFLSTLSKLNKRKSKNKPSIINQVEILPPKPTTRKNAGNFILPYLNLGLIILFFVGLGFFGYRQLIIQTPTSLAFPGSPVKASRVLSFQGRLTDTSQNPITTATNMEFKIWDQLSGGTEGTCDGTNDCEYKTTTCSVTPDQDGIFNVGIGDDCGSEIDDAVFTENAALWLEVIIASETLTPRQPIRVVPFAINSETVQGYPISASQAATVNTLLVMDSGGYITLGEDSPKLNSVSGTFTISGGILSLSSTGDLLFSDDNATDIPLTVNDGTLNASLGQGLIDAINDAYDAATGGTGGLWEHTSHVVNTSDYWQDDFIVGGNATASADIQLYSDGSAVFNEQGNDADLRIEGTSDNLFFADASTNRIGIGTNTPDNNLQVYGSNAILSVGISDNGRGFTSLYGAGTGSISGGELALYTPADYDGTVNYYRIAASSDDLVIGRAGSNDINISQAGYVGIGDNTPASLFSVGNGDLFQVNTTGSIVAIDGIAHTLTDTAGDLELTSNSTNISLNDNVTFGGTTTLNTVAYTWPGADGTSGYSLTSNGSGTLSWTDVSGGGSTVWTNTLNAYHPSDEFASIADIIIGGTSTASADIQLYSDGSAVFNEQGADADFRVEGDTDTNLLFVDASTDRVGIGDSSPASLFTVGSGDLFQIDSTGSIIAIDNVAHTITDTAGDLTLTSAGTQINFADTNVFNIGGLTGVAYNAISDSGTANLAATDDDLYIEGILEVDSNLNLAASSYINWGDTDGTSGYGLRDNAGTIQYKESGGSWADVGSGGGGSSLWQETAGSIAPANDTFDLLIGGTATGSAKFAFMNVNSGTPTASISGNLAIASPTGADPTTSIDILNGGSLNVRTSVGGDAGLLSRLFIDNDGNVGIGTATPTSKLDIAGATSTISNSSGDITLDATSNSINFSGDSLTNLLNLEASGQIKPGSYGSNPTAIGDGAIIYRSDQTELYYYNGTSWTALSSGGGSSLFTNTLNVIHPSNEYASIADLAIGGTSTSSALIHLNASNGYISAQRFVDRSNSNYYLDPATTGTSLTLVGRSGLGVSAPDFQLEVEASEPGKALVSFNQLADQSIFVASSSGTNVFDIQNDGDIIIGNSTKDDVQVTLHGDLFQPDETNLETGFTDIRQTFLYDTTRDRDGGSWRKSIISKSLSWYTESKDDGFIAGCTLASDDRCGQSRFPAKANLVLTDSSLYIMDVTTNRLWMKFDQGSSNSLGVAANNEPRSVYAKNGRIFVGTTGSSSATGLYEINFNTDGMYYYDTTGRTKSDETISGRNNGSNVYSNSEEAYILSNSNINDIDGGYADGKQYLALATNGGINLLDLDHTLSYTYKEVASDSNGDTITDDGNNGNAATDAFDGVPTDYVRSDVADSTLIVTYQFTAGKTIRRYGMVMDDVGGANEFPYDWTFEGSNNGSDWTVLDTKVNYEFEDTGTLSNYQYFPINNDTSYTYYKVDVTDVKNGAADSVTIGEIYLQERHETEAVRLFSDDVTTNFTSAVSSADNGTTLTHRRINDWRRTNNVGDARTETGVTLPWYQLTMRQPKVITQYTVTSANTDNEEPTAWDIKGSNDGVNWTTLDTQTSQSFGTYDPLTYTFSNTTAYKYYRLDVTANNGDVSNTEIGDFMVGTPVITASSSLNNTQYDETNLIFQDNDNTVYYWISAVGTGADEWVKYDYGSGNEVAIKSYGVRGYQPGQSTRAIKDFRLQGSNNDSDWTDLDTQTTQSFSHDYDMNTYKFSNSTAYRYYRLYVDAANGGTYATLQGFYLFGQEDRLIARSDENNALDDASRLMDYGDFGRWTSYANDDTGFIEKQFAAGQAATVSGLVLYGSASLNESIRDFDFQGSNDRTTWTTLGTIDRSVMTGSVHSRSYMFPNDIAYQFYRVNIKATYNATVTSVDEIELLGSRYNNVRFTGNGLAATNVTTSKIDVFNDIFTQEKTFNPDGIRPNSHKVLDWGGAGVDNDEIDVALSTSPIITAIDQVRRHLPALTGGVEEEKRAFEVDGNEIFFGHANGLDQIRINPNAKLITTDMSDEDDFDTRAQIQASYNTSRIIANKYKFDHYWPMEEGPDATTITDYGTGNGHSVTFGTSDYDSIPTSSASGKIGRAFEFDEATDQYITIEEESISRWDGNGNDEFSLGFWVYPDGDSVDTADQFILGDYLLATNVYGLEVGLDGTAQRLRLYGGAGGAATINTRSETAVMENDTWTHIIINRVNDAQGNYFNIYKNGELVDSIAGVNLTDGRDFKIGAGGESNQTASFDGRIDEVFIKYSSLSEDQIKNIYKEGVTNDMNNTTSMEGARAVAADDASVVSTTTIGDSQLVLGENDYVGRIVEITGGTGVGQSRLIISNTDTTLTISPAWGTTPDSTSDFVVTPYALPGSVNEVKAVRADQKDLFIGLNDNSNGGGVVRVNRNNYGVVDYYHGEASKSDDQSADWDTTSGYDDIVDIETTQDNLIIASETTYWQEKVGDSLTEIIDKLQQAFSANLVNTHTNDFDGSSIRNNTRQVIRKGWSYIDATDVAKDIYYGISYDEVPLVFVSATGETGGNGLGAPTSLEQCQAIADNELPVNVGNIKRERFTVAEAAANNACFTWLAIGDYSDSMPDGSFAGGADLAEWYGTDDETLQAGEIVAIDKSGDIKVVRSSTPQDSSAIGIIATQPSITLGPDSGLTPGYTDVTDAGLEAKSAVEVALAGRVPVRVSLENGPIKPGDYLTTGSVPGVAVKAIYAGPTIGKAMEEFDGTSTIIAIGNDNSPLDLVGIEHEANNSIATNSAKLDGTVQILDQDQQDLANGYGYVMAFVNTSYFDPGYADLNLSSSLNTDSDGSFAISSTGKLMGLGSYSFDLVDNSKYSNEVYQETVSAMESSLSAKLASGSATISREGVLAAALARLKTLGSLSLKELNTAQLRVMDTIFSRTSQSDTVETDLIKPFVSNNLNLQIGNASESGTLDITNSNGDILAQVDDKGNATFLGQLLAKDDLIVEGNASVAGTFTANAIDTKSARIDTLESKLAQLEHINAQTANIINATISGTLYASNIDGFKDKVEEALKEPSLLSKILGIDDQATSSASPASTANILADAGFNTFDIDSNDAGLTANSLNLNINNLDLNTTDIVLSADATFINDYFKVNGHGFIADSLGVGQNLFVNNNIKIGSNTTINDGSLSFTPNSDNPAFQIQPSGTGSLSFMAGLLSLDENGQAIIDGDLTITGDLTIEDTLLTDLILPTNFTNPLQVQLATRSGSVAGITDEEEVLESRFEIINELGTPVATISAQGRASFESGISFGSQNLTQDSTATTSARVSADKTTGVATIKSQTNQLTIQSPLITEETLIYITPLGPTGNQVMYIKSKTVDNIETNENEAAFTIGFENPVDSDIEFNWWIVN